MRRLLLIVLTTCWFQPSPAFAQQAGAGDVTPILEFSAGVIDYEVGSASFDASNIMLRAALSF